MVRIRRNPWKKVKVGIGKIEFKCGRKNGTIGARSFWFPSIFLVFVVFEIKKSGYLAVVLENALPIVPDLFIYIYPAYKNKIFDLSGLVKTMRLSACSTA